VLTTARNLIDNGPSLSVGILSADLLRLGEELETLESAGVRLAHIDVMDGVFSPQLTVGPPLVRALPERFVKDVHLMVADPLNQLQSYIDAGAGIISFHLEATMHPHRVLQSLAGTGIVRGVALNPGTPLASVEPLLDELELLLLLAVNPGWSGQPFIASTEGRITEAQALLAAREIVLGVDGGITKANAERVASLGVNLIVTGSAVYDGVPADNVRALLAAVEGTRVPTTP
jgi:ribulose-phosphate 3-epimerase